MENDEGQEEYGLVWYCGCDSHYIVKVWKMKLKQAARLVTPIRSRHVVPLTRML
ncbi:hypothetical protein COLO4_26940 [Corchorus olitorius]|uniref:Uncharacterized protein n=1 Tax=Corchorus olitorius TaxID=93759 RepID=A0A1R3HTK5_9ROSI|nr:hypothetical protein COLO4_26940 [Corchorus olitorius]